jgi:hypothetical protein
MLMAGLDLRGYESLTRNAGAQSAGVLTIAPSPATLSAAAELRLPAGQPLQLAPAVGELMTRGSRGNRRQGEILMIVGAAGIVTGLLVDEDLVTIAGAAVGGFGLYLYLEATR